MEEPLKPGEWLDTLNWDALATEADVKDLFERVAVLEAELKAKAIERASRN